MRFALPILILLAALSISRGSEPVYIPITQYDEQPQWLGNNKWQLAQSPTRVPRCFRNGLAQTSTAVQPPDFTIIGNIITSQFWQTGDVISCDYQW